MRPIISSKHNKILIEPENYNWFKIQIKDWLFFHIWNFRLRDFFKNI